MEINDPLSVKEKIALRRRLSRFLKNMTDRQKECAKFILRDLIIAVGGGREETELIREYLKTLSMEDPRRHSVEGKLSPGAGDIKRMLDASGKQESLYTLQIVNIEDRGGRKSKRVSLTDFGRELTKRPGQISPANGLDGSA